MDLKPKSLLRRVLDFARDELERRSRPPAPGGEQPSASDPPPASPVAPPERPRAESIPAPRGSTALDVSRTDNGRLVVRWAVDEADLTRTRALVHGDAVLCLRVVAFERTRDDVKRDVLDRPCIEATGDCELALSELRGVVSLGLRAGERFVSITHHVV